MIAATFVGVAVRGASAGRSAGTIIERTFLCTIGSFAGLRGISATASSRQEGAGFPAFASVASDEGLAEVLTGVVSGRPTGVSFNVNRCRATRLRVPLSPRGLSGGAAPLGAGAKCGTGKRILMHLRAVMESRPMWTSKPPFRIARGKPVEAAVAVRTYPANKPLVYMAIRDQTARLYSAPRCF